MRLGSGAIWSGAVTFRTEIVSISNKFTVEDMIFSCCSLILIQYIPPLKAAFLSLQRTAFWILERGKGIQSPSQAFPLPNSWTCLSRVRAKVVLQRCSEACSQALVLPWSPDFSLWNKCFLCSVGIKEEWSTVANQQLQKREGGEEGSQKSTTTKNLPGN